MSGSQEKPNTTTPTVEMNPESLIESSEEETLDLDTAEGRKNFLKAGISLFKQGYMLRTALGFEHSKSGARTTEVEGNFPLRMQYAKLKKSIGQISELANKRLEIPEESIIKVQTEYNALLKLRDRVEAFAASKGIDVEKVYAGANTVPLPEDIPEESDVGKPLSQEARPEQPLTTNQNMNEKPNNPGKPVANAETAVDQQDAIKNLERQASAEVPQVYGLLMQMSRLKEQFGENVSSNFTELANELQAAKADITSITPERLKEISKIIADMRAELNPIPKKEDVVGAQKTEEQIKQEAVYGKNEDSVLKEMKADYLADKQKMFNIVTANPTLKDSEEYKKYQAFNAALSDLLVDQKTMASNYFQVRQNRTGVKRQIETLSQMTSEGPSREGVEVLSAEQLRQKMGAYEQEMHALMDAHGDAAVEATGEYLVYEGNMRMLRQILLSEDGVNQSRAKEILANIANEIQRLKSRFGSTEESANENKVGMWTKGSLREAFPDHFKDAEKPAPLKPEEGEGGPKPPTQEEKKVYESRLELRNEWREKKKAYEDAYKNYLNNLAQEKQNEGLLRKMAFWKKDVIPDSVTKMQKEYQDARAKYADVLDTALASRFVNRVTDPEQRKEGLRAGLANRFVLRAVHDKAFIERQFVPTGAASKTLAGMQEAFKKHGRTLRVAGLGFTAVTGFVTGGFALALSAVGGRMISGQVAAMGAMTGAVVGSTIGDVGIARAGRRLENTTRNVQKSFSIDRLLAEEVTYEKSFAGIEKAKQRKKGLTIAGAMAGAIGGAALAGNIDSAGEALTDIDVPATEVGPGLTDSERYLLEQDGAGAPHIEDLQTSEGPHIDNSFGLTESERFALEQNGVNAPHIEDLQPQGPHIDNSFPLTPSEAYVPADGVEVPHVEDLQTPEGPYIDNSYGLTESERYALEQNGAGAPRVEDLQTPEAAPQPTQSVDDVWDNEDDGGFVEAPQEPAPAPEVVPFNEQLFTFEAGNRIDSVSEAAFDLWKQDPTLVEQQLSRGDFLEKMWEIRNEAIENPAFGAELTEKMGIASGDIDRVGAGETVNLAPLYELINQRN